MSGDFETHEINHPKIKNLKPEKKKGLNKAPQKIQIIFNCLKNTWNNLTCKIVSSY